MDDQRFHLTLYTGDRPVMHGWWADRATAERKFTRWIGEFSGVADPRITLADEQDGSVLTTWPDEP